MGIRKIGIGALVAMLVCGCNRSEDENILHGNVDDRELQLAFVLSERLASVIPEEGTSVKKGDLIAELETVRVENEVAVAQAALKASEAKLKEAQARMDKSDNGERAADIEKVASIELSLKAKRDVAEREMLRMRNLVKTHAVAAQEAENAEANYYALRGEHAAAVSQLALLREGDRPEDRAATRANLEEARAAVAEATAHLKVAERKLADCRLYAPADGIVRERLLEPGEYTSPMSPVISLALTSPKWVRCYLRETQLARHKLNDKATVHVDGLEKTFEGWIGFISPTAEFTPKNIETDALRPTLVYETRIYVKDPEGLLKLGAPVVVNL